RQTISELGRGFGGTSIVAFYGIILVALVLAPISKALPASRSAILCVSALGVIAVGCIGLDLVAAESGSWDAMTWRGQLHLIFAFVFVFGGIPAACLAASRALPPSLRGLRLYSLATGFGCLALLVATLVALGQSPPIAAIASRLGLIERVYVFSFLIWQCIVSALLTRPTHKDIR
ncbi:MAG: DUF998 domain-containing protein, partial [Acidobacteria bacterium]